MARNDKAQVKRPKKKQGSTVVLPLKSLPDPVGLRRGWDLRHKTLVVVTGSRDFSYFIDVNVGGQPFNVALDSGSADLWIESSDCNTSACSGVPQYSRSSSMSPTGSTVKITYLAGSVCGQVVKDIVRLAQYEVYSQSLALAMNVTNIGLSQMGISGMLGLAFPTIASISSDQGIPLILNILNSLDLDSRFFAFRLGRDIGSTLGRSSFMIGQHDPIVPDPAAIRYIPVYPKDLAANTYDYWKIPLDGIIVNNRSLALSRSRISSSRAPICVFDSGTSLMVGPTMDVARFYSMLALGSPQKDGSGQWMLDCDVAVDLLVVLGGRAFPIHPLDVSWDKLSDGRGRCTGGIQANDGVLSGDWLFGDTVMRNIYTSHFIETFRSPPLLGLYSMTTPSNSLRQFILARGSQFYLESDALFSDSVLQISYSSFYSLDSHLDLTALSNNGSAIVNDSIPLNYYEHSSDNDGGHWNGSRWGRDVFVCVLAVTVGFAAGALLNVVRTIFVGPRRVREPSHHRQQQQLLANGRMEERNDRYTTLTKRQSRLGSRWTGKEFGARDGGSVGGRSSGRRRMSEKTGERSSILSQNWTRGSSRSQRKG